MKLRVLLLGRQGSFARRLVAGLMSLLVAALTSLPIGPSMAEADDQQGTTIFLGKYFEKRPDGTTVKYIYAGDQLIAAVVNPPTGPQRIQYVHGDHLGSTSVVTSESGAVLARREYRPYGTTSQEQGSSSVPHQFTGQRFDPSTNLHYYNGRYYDSDLGRFTQPDPYVQAPADPQFLNRYSYVRNNPVNYVDPSGNFAFLAVLGAILVKAAIGAAVGAAVSVGIGAATGQIHSWSDAGRFAGAGAAGGAVAAVGGYALAAAAPHLTATGVYLGELGIAATSSAVGMGVDSAMQGGSFGRGAATGALWGVGFFVGGTAIGAGARYIGSTPFGEALGRQATRLGEAVADTALAKGLGTFLDDVGLGVKPVGEQAYAGIRRVSTFLQESGVPRETRKYLLGSLDPRTVGMEYAGASSYGLRYYGGTAGARSNWLFETFPAGRESLAVPYGNTMQYLKQWRIRPGAPIIYGRGLPQGPGLPGGQMQQVIVDPLQDLLEP